MTDREKQKIVDDEHLKLLRIGYYVSAGADALFALFPLIYVFMGIFIAAAGSGSANPGEPNPAVFGVIFAVIGLVVSFFLAANAGLKFMAAKAIGERRSKTLCYVAAALSCLAMPWGTLLGVFTFMTLGRESVSEQFSPTRRASLAEPPVENARSVVFDRRGARRAMTPEDSGQRTADSRRAPIKPAVGIEALDALDIRVGTIVEVSFVEKSSKLVRLRVDFGDHVRTILAGMRKEREDPTEIVGRQALFVVNLEPRKMAGETSEGMLFDIGYSDGVVPVLAVPEKPVPNGTRAG